MTRLTPGPSSLGPDTGRGGARPGGRQAPTRRNADTATTYAAMGGASRCPGRRIPTSQRFRTPYPATWTAPTSLHGMCTAAAEERSI